MADQHALPPPPRGSFLGPMASWGVRLQQNIYSILGVAAGLIIIGYIATTSIWYDAGRSTNKVPGAVADFLRGIQGLEPNAPMALGGQIPIRLGSFQTTLGGPPAQIGGYAFQGNQPASTWQYQPGGTTENSAPGLVSPPSSGGSTAPTMSTEEVTAAMQAASDAWQLGDPAGALEALKPIASNPDTKVREWTRNLQMRATRANNSLAQMRDGLRSKADAANLGVAVVAVLEENANVAEAKLTLTEVNVAMKLQSKYVAWIEVVKSAGLIEGGSNDAEVKKVIARVYGVGGTTVISKKADCDGMRPIGCQVETDDTLWLLTLVPPDDLSMALSTIQPLNWKVQKGVLNRIQPGWMANSSAVFAVEPVAPPVAKQFTPAPAKPLPAIPTVSAAPPVPVATTVAPTTGPASRTAPSSPPPAGGKQVTVDYQPGLQCTSGVGVGTIVGVVPRGTSLPVLATSGDRVQVSFSGSQCWVRGTSPYATVR